MDGMTSLDYAKEKLGIDYTKHKNFLIKNNFEIVPSKSNYNTTYLSLASILQLNYVVNPSSPRYHDRNNFWPYILSNKENKPNLIKILEKYGYNFRWYGNITASCKNYSYNKNFCSSSEIQSNYYVFNTFYLSTPIITILRKFFPDTMLNFYGDKIDSLSNFLNDDDKFSKNNKSLFTFIHHLSPHPPYIYNSDCSLKKNINTSISSNEIDGYKDSYLCSLKRIEQFVDYLSKYDSTALIVITADHGWILEKSNSNQINEIINGTAGSEIIKNSMREKSKIYNSIKINKECKESLPKNLDNINSIRLILGCAINKRAKLLDSKTFYGFQEENKKDYGKVYELN